MNKPIILIAVHPAEVDWRRLIVLIVGKEFEYVCLDALDDKTTFSREFRVAVIDENFGSEGGGWEIAKMIRKHKGSSVQIVMISKSRSVAVNFGDATKQELFDWIVAPPFTPEELTGEIRRRLQILERTN